MLNHRLPVAEMVWACSTDTQRSDEGGMVEILPKFALRNGWTFPWAKELLVKFWNFRLNTNDNFDNNCVNQ